MKNTIKNLLHNSDLFTFLKSRKQRKKRNREAIVQEEFYMFQNLSLHTKKRFTLEWEDVFPCLDDRTSHTGFDRHYVYHPAWAARIIRQTNPAFHVDISSTLYFCSIVSAFVPVKFYDYRPADLHLPGLSSKSANLMSLPFESNSVESISCMHTVEHIGLGRYGDPFDYDGDLKAISELKRVLAKGGNLLFVVPIGQPKIVFNAHRIYSYDQISSYFADLELENFSLIPDNPAEGGLINGATKEMSDAQAYGCGCFWFSKK
jgi:SAM-dependent methyltransferase